MPLPSIRSILRGAIGAGLASLLIASAAPSGGRRQRQQNGESNNPEQTLSDAVGDGISKIRPLLDAKNWNGAERVSTN